MKYLLFCAIINELPNNYDICNNGIVSAGAIVENFLRYILQEQKTAPDKLIIFWRTYDISTSNAANANLLTRMQFWKKEKSFHTDCFNCIEEIEQISASAGIKQPEVEIVKISDNEKDDRKLFSEVRRIVGESGVPKEDIFVTVADTSTSGSDVLDMTMLRLEFDGYTVEKLHIDPEKGIADHSETSLNLELYKAICKFKDTGITDTFNKLGEKISNKLLAELLEQLDHFSGNLNLCQTEDLEPTLDKIYNILDSLEHDAADNIEGLVCDKLRSVFGDSKPQLLSMVYIKCCLSWKWTTQSLVLFTEVLPKELVMNKIVQCDFSSFTNATLAPEVELFYTRMTRDMYIPKEKELKSLLVNFLKGETGNDSKNLYIEDFIVLIKWFEKGMEEKGLTIPFEGIDILYLFPEKNDGVRQLTEFIYHNCSSLTMDKFREKLSSSMDSIRYFFKDSLMYDKENTISQKIMGIKYLYPEHMRRNLDGFRLNIDYSKFSFFKRFLAFFLYLKLVRNRVCHAIPLQTLDDDLNEDHKDRLKCFGVDTGTVTYESLSRNITNALSCLKECLLSNAPRTIHKYYVSVPAPDEVDDIENDIDSHLRSLFENVPSFDTVRIFVIKDKKKEGILEKALIAKIDEYAICNDFFCDIENISDSDEPSEFISNLLSTVEPGDKIGADTTYMNNIKMYGMIMFFNAVIEKKAEIGKVICKDYCLTDLINSQFGA